MSARPRFDVSLVTPDGTVFEGDAEMLIVPGAAGEIGVLARHAPLVATLKAGATRVHLGAGQVEEYATGPGFFTVQLDRAIALVDHAVKATEIDREAAERMLEEAKAELERIEQRRVDRRPVGRRAAAHPRADAARGRDRRLGPPRGAREAHPGRLAPARPAATLFAPWRALKAAWRPG